MASKRLPRGCHSRQTPAGRLGAATHLSPCLVPGEGGARCIHRSRAAGRQAVGRERGPLCSAASWVGHVWADALLCEEIISHRRERDQREARSKPEEQVERWRLMLPDTTNVTKNTCYFTMKEVHFYHRGTGNID